MASQGPRSGGTFVTITTADLFWSGPSDAVSSNDIYATSGALSNGDRTEDLKATNFGFTIPSGATIDGIVVEVERKASAATALRDWRFRIVKGGTISVTDRKTTTAWSTTDAYVTYGSSSDKWGETWTPADINGTTFGVIVAAEAEPGSGTASVDHIRITVYYTDAPTEVSTTRDLRWSVSQAVPTTRDLRWQVLAPVSDTSDLRWSVLAAVSDTLDLRWQVLASTTEVSTTRDLRWSVLQAISDALDVRWSVSVALSVTRDLRWSVLAAVAKASDLQWSVLGQVSKTADLRWSLLAIMAEPQTRVITTPGRTASFPLGVFLLPSPLEEVTGGQKMVTYEAYDQSQILLDDKVTARYVAVAGSNVIAEVRALLNSASIVKQNLTATDKVLFGDLSWEPGTPKLTIINALLRLINYVTLYFDSSGYATCRPYVVPTDAAVAYEYRDDAISVIHEEAQRTLDLFSVPNEWVVMVSDADRELISTFTNTNPDSPTSTVTRGRTIVSFRSARPEDAVDQATLDALAERIAFEESQVYETVHFTSAIMPIHEEAEVLWLEHTALAVDGKYQETGWDFELVAGARMNHQVRKAVDVS